MRHVRLILPLCLLLVVCAAVLVQQQPSSARGRGRQFAPVLFSDDFSGPAGASFDPDKWQEWSACTYNGSAAYGNIGCGAPETLDGRGHLQIPATPRRGASLSTATRFAAQYGTFSASIKTPAQVGYWPAFWTLNNSPDGHDLLPLGEADVFEGYTTWPTVAHHGAHTWNGEQSWSSDDDRSCTGGADLSAAFHRYAMKVEPGRITFYFDQKQCGTVATAVAGEGKPYGFGPSVGRGNWMLLTLAVGGAGGQQQPATQDAVMLVDSVMVTALPS